MVLAELGGRLRSSLQKLHSSTGAIDPETLDEILSDLSRALIESDVNVKLVMGLRTNIKNRVGKAVEDASDASTATSSAMLTAIWTISMTFANPASGGPRPMGPLNMRKCSVTSSTK